MRRGKPLAANFVYVPKPIQIMHPSVCGRAVGDHTLVRGEEGRGEGGEGGECRVKALGDKCLGQRKRWEREC